MFDDPVSYDHGQDGQPGDLVAEVPAVLVSNP
jgi:hypothetical protein